MSTRPLKVFISYKWEGEDHSKWVRKFAADLRSAGLDALLDVWEVRLGDSFTDYMTSRITAADVVLFIMTTQSVKAVESLRGGAVKFEMQMATSRRVASENMRLIGIYREGNDTPAHIRDHRHIDFRDDAHYSEKLYELIDDLLGRNKPPPLLADGQLPNDPETCNTLGEMYYMAGDYQKASVYFGQAIRMVPSVASFYISRGNCRYQQRIYDQAVEDYNIAITLEPLHAPHYFARGSVLHEKHEFFRAIEDFTQAISLTSNETDYYQARGRCYLSLGDYDQAMEDFKHSVKLDPGNSDYHYSLSICNQHKGNFDLALEHINYAIEFNPNKKEYFEHRGKLHFRQRDYARVIEDFNRAIMYDPNSAWYFFWRGLAHEESRDVEAARQDFKRASSLGGTDVAKALLGYPMNLVN